MGKTLSTESQNLDLKPNRTKNEKNNQ